MIYKTVKYGKRSNGQDYFDYIIQEDFKKKVEHFRNALKGVCNYDNDPIQLLLNKPLV